MAKTKDDLCSQNLDLRVGKVASCTIKLKLDVRHEQNDEFCPVSLYFFLNGARWYYPLGDRMTREEFYLVSHATGKGRISMNAQGERPYDIKLRLEEVFEMYLSKLQQLHKRGRLTISSIKTMVTGGTGSDGQDFISKCLPEKYSLITKGKKYFCRRYLAERKHHRENSVHRLLAVPLTVKREAILD